MTSARASTLLPKRTNNSARTTNACAVNSIRPKPTSRLPAERANARLPLSPKVLRKLSPSDLAANAVLPTVGTGTALLLHRSASTRLSTPLCPPFAPAVAVPSTKPTLLPSSRPRSLVGRSSASSTSMSAAAVTVASVSRGVTRCRRPTLWALVPLRSAPMPRLRVSCSIRLRGCLTPRLPMSSTRCSASS